VIATYTVVSNTSLVANPFSNFGTSETSLLYLISASSGTVIPLNVGPPDAVGDFLSTATSNFNSLINVITGHLYFRIRASANALIAHTLNTYEFQVTFTTAVSCMDGVRQLTSYGCVNPSTGSVQNEVCDDADSNGSTDGCTNLCAIQPTFSCI